MLVGAEVEGVSGRVGQVCNASVGLSSRWLNLDCAQTNQPLTLAVELVDLTLQIEMDRTRNHLASLKTEHPRRSRPEHNPTVSIFPLYLEKGERRRPEASQVIGVRSIESNKVECGCHVEYSTLATRSLVSKV